MRPGLWHRVGLLAGAIALAGCGAGLPEETAGATKRMRPVTEPGTAVHSGPRLSEPSGSVDAAPVEPVPTETDRAVIAEPSHTAGRADAVKEFRSVRGHLDVPPPSTVRIPAIGVESALVNLVRERDGTVQVPKDFQRAGWFSEGPAPGQPGPAVILGHVDSRAGPAVFYRLHELEPGDEIVVDRSDGSTARFTVDRVERYGKDEFPTYAVYYPTLKSTLRLVTCGGAFDSEARSYRDNLIVFASNTR